MKMFPIQRSDPIPWSVAETAYTAYVARYGSQQTLARLADRGGFGIDEMDLLFPAWRPACAVEINALNQHEDMLELLASAYSIADRCGESTNWAPFRAAVLTCLASHGRNGVTPRTYRLP